MKFTKKKRRRNLKYSRKLFHAQIKLSSSGNYDISHLTKEEFENLYKHSEN